MGSLFRIALRNVLRNRRRSLITFSAVFLALTIMVGLRGFLNGLQATISQTVIGSQTGALQIHGKGFAKSVNASLELNMPSDEAFLGRIKAVPGVKEATARIAFGAMANANDTTAFAMFIAIDPKRESIVCPQRMEAVSEGRSLDGAGPAAALFTPELSGAIGTKVTGKATILTNDKEGVMNALDVDVVGAYGQPGLPLPEKKLGFVPLAFAQDLLRMEGRATEIAVAIDTIEAANQMKATLQAALGPAYEVTTWHDAAPFIDDAIAAQNAILSIIAGIFLFVALLGIANTMLMSVYERTREIGTMMAVGVRRRQILILFLLEAALVGLAGGMLGAMGGGAFVLYYGSRGFELHIPGTLKPLHVFPFVSPGYIAFILAIATLGATLAALWPSLRASRLRPVEALASV